MSKKERCFGLRRNLTFTKLFIKEYVFENKERKYAYQLLGFTSKNGIKSYGGAIQKSTK